MVGTLIDNSPGREKLRKYRSLKDQSVIYETETLSILEQIPICRRHKSSETPTQTPTEFWRISLIIPYIDSLIMTVFF